MRSAVAASACALALVVAACGGDTTSSASGTESAATVAPASASGYLALSTDLDSAQWKQIQELAGRFPGGRDRLLETIEGALDAEDLDLERDLEPALGPETALVFLESTDEVVALTQPDDRAKLRALLDRADAHYVTREIDGWTAIAETEATLDAFARGREAGTLDDDAGFQEAIADLPEEAFAKAYVTGEGLDEAAGSLSGSGGILTGGGRLVSVVAWLEALDEGARLGGVVRSEGGDPGEPYEPTLLERVPDDALLVLTFKDLNRTIEQARENEAVGESLAGAEDLLGVSFDELGQLLAGESVLYARPGLPIPEVTLLLDVESTETALATLDRLAARIAPAVDGTLGTTDADGVQQKYLEIGDVRISYAAFDGLVAITSGARGIRDARSDGDKLPDDDRFRDAKEAAGLGDATSGFLYIDLKDAIPLLEGVAEIAGTRVPDDTAASLDPLETLLVQVSRDGDELRFSGFLGVS